MASLTPAGTAAVVQALAAVFTFGAACVALYITSEAPKRAVKLAEQLRVESEFAEARRIEKYRIFRTLMDHRGRDLSAPEPVDAINMIYVVFHDDFGVQKAHKELMFFINGIENRGNFSRAYMTLCAEIAKSLGFPDSLTGADIDRGYFPTKRKPDLPNPL